MKHLLLITLCLVLGGCATSPSITEEAPIATAVPMATIDPQAPFPADLLIRFVRGYSPFSDSPAYIVTIDANGNVTYESVENVAVKGKHSTTITREQVQQLLEALNKAQFFSLENEYPPTATDLPIIGISLQINGHTKSVSHSIRRPYDKRSELERLEVLEQSIDRIVNTDQWVKKP